ncbi:hypothetical protein [Streptomyces sp. NPDC007172]
MKRTMVAPWRTTTMCTGAGAPCASREAVQLTDSSPFTSYVTARTSR